MAAMSTDACRNCGWPAQEGKDVCETCDKAPFEDERRPWYIEYGEWVNGDGTVHSRELREQA